jgi:hypothetical protein
MRTLFVAIALIGVGLGLYRLLDVRNAHRNYDQAWADFEAQTTSASDVCRASAEWRDAELQVPFANRRNAVAPHLWRVAVLLTLVERVATVALSGDGGESHQRWLAEIRRGYYVPALHAVREEGDSIYANRIESEMRKSDPYERDLPQP